MTFENAVANGNNGIYSITLVEWYMSNLAFSHFCQNQTLSPSALEVQQSDYPPNKLWVREDIVTMCKMSYLLLLQFFLGDIQ